MQKNGGFIKDLMKYMQMSVDQSLIARPKQGGIPPEKYKHHSRDKLQVKNTHVKRLLIMKCFTGPF